MTPPLSNPVRLDLDALHRLVRDMDAAESSEVPRLDGFTDWQPLGSGGFGHVYRVTQFDPVQRTVAIKVLKQSLLSPADHGRYQSEAGILASFDPTLVVPLFDVRTTSDGRLCLIMEYVAGGDLQRRLKDKPLPPNLAAQLVERLARAVESAHARGIFHRDLKPANVLLSTAEVETARLADFGLALHIDSPTFQQTARMRVGTPGYHPPEIEDGSLVAAVGVEPLSEDKRQDLAARFRRVDVWGLGTILWQCLTGQWPRNDTQDRGAIPAKPRAICLKCLEKEPEKRYATAQLLADDLRAFLERRPTVGVPTEWLEQYDLWYWRNFWPVNAIVVLVVGLVVALSLAGAFLWQKDEADKQRIVAEANAEKERLERQKANRERRIGEVLRYKGLLDEARQALRDNNLSMAVAKLDSTDNSLRGWEYDHLAAQCGDELGKMSLPGLPTAVAVGRRLDGTELLAVALTGDGIHLGPFKDKDKSFTTSHQIPVPKDRKIVQLTFTPDGRWLLAGGVSRFQSVVRGTIVAWNTDQPNDVKPLEIGSDFHIVTQGREPFKEDTSSALSRFAISADGQHIAFIAEPMTVKVWGFQERRIVAVSASQKSAVLGVAFHPDKDRKEMTVCGGFAGSGGYIGLWRWEQGSTIDVIKEDDKPLREVQYIDPEGLAVVVQDQLRFYQFDAEGKKLTPKGDDLGLDKTRAFAWHPEKQRFTLGGRLGQGEVVRCGESLLRGSMSDVAGLAFTTDGSRIVSVSGDANPDNRLRLWTAMPVPKEVAKLPTTWRETSLTSVDGKVRAVLQDDNTIRVTVPSDDMGDFPRVLNKAKRKVKQMAFDVKEIWLIVEYKGASPTSRREIELWDVWSGESVFAMELVQE